MDITDFIEKVFNIKLLDYQKKYIRYIDTHPKCQIVFARSRTTPSWYMSYLITKYILLEEYKNEHKRN